MKPSLIILCCLVFISSTFPQTGFQPQQIINQSGGAYAIHSADIDGDGLADVISSSSASDNVSWYRNDGDGASFTEFEISNDDYAVWVVYAVDVDSDGDNDIIVGTYDDVRWYANDGLGNFSYRKIITNNVDVVKSVHAGDLDGDGDLDVVYTSMFDNKVAFSRNRGDGTFDYTSTIATGAADARCVIAVDIDNDSILDVVYSSYSDNNVSWSKNLGDADFGERQVIGDNLNGAIWSYAADLDNDGDNDVMAASRLNKQVVWYENNGNGAFGEPQVVLSSDYRCTYVYADDLDNDGMVEILSGDSYHLYYNLNLGNGNFESAEVITDLVVTPRTIFAVDLDNDGDKDVLSGSQMDSKKTIYKNNFNRNVDYFEGFCEGDSTYIMGQWINEAGHYYDSLNTIFGGDSIGNYFTTVYLRPDTFSIDGNTTVVEYQTHTYSAPVSPVYSYQWEVQNGNIVEYFSDNSISVHWGAWGSGCVIASVIIPETGCASSDSLMVSIGGVGISEPGLNIARAYPNPAASYLIISTSAENMNVEMFNTLGESVLKTMEKKIDISELPEGCVYLLYKDNDDTVVGREKIIICH